MRYCHALPVTPNELYIVSVMTAFHATDTDGVTIRRTTSGASKEQNIAHQYLISPLQYRYTAKKTGDEKKDSEQFGDDVLMYH